MNQRLKFMDFGFWQFLETFGIPVSNFPAFYEHNRDRPLCPGSFRVN